MRMMRLCTLALLCSGTCAFVLRPISRPQTNNNHVFSSSALFSTPNEEEKASTSFDEAGRSLIDEEDQKRMDAMGDFDSNPEFKTDNIEKMRTAIRERANELGVEKSEADRLMFEEMAAKARVNAGNQQANQLDLSQISTGEEVEPGGNQWDEEMPSMFYDPEDLLTEEEKMEVDKVGFMSPWEQFLEEFKASEWPTPVDVIKRLATMIGLLGLSVVIIVGWDKTVRYTFTEVWDFIPTKEKMNMESRVLDLPDGFTKGMDEEGLAKLTDQMNKAGKAKGLSDTEVQAKVSEATIAAPVEDL